MINRYIFFRKCIVLNAEGFEPETFCPQEHTGTS